MLTSIAAVENFWISLTNETKPWLREAAILTVRNQNEHRYPALSYTGHDALLQAIDTHCHTHNQSWRDSGRH